MAGPTRSEIRGRIRGRLVEATPKFWTDDQVDHAYDEGAGQQHRTVAEAARATGRLQPTNNDYVRHFLTSTSALTLTIDQRDYSVPTDSIAILDVWVGTKLVACRQVSIEDDWNIRNLGSQYEPTEDQPLYAFNNELIRIYLPTADLSPDAALPYQLDYLRKVVREGDPVDVEDPFNAGPCAYACGYLQSFRMMDPSPYYQEAGAFANGIIPPPPQPGPQ